MAPGEGAPLSLRPFPVADKKPKNLAEFVARVNAQPGGFRELKSARLQEGIAAREASGPNEDEDMGVSEEEDDDDDDEKAAGEADPAKVRQEILMNLEIAGNTAMLTLDTLSLLLSKHNPNQVSGTLSKSLRDMVGIGTLGGTRLDEPRVSEKRYQENETIALGWTLKEIDKTRKSAEDAVSFLEKEIEAEGKYWEEVISVQKKGWAVCRMPSEPSTLGVRFGFSEAAPEFKNNGLAPMRRSEDGVVNLDSGRLGGVSERILVTYEKDGKVVGRSALPAQTEETAPLEARVLEARNTLYSQELWHELGREARLLLAYDVRREDSRLRWDIDGSSSITAELVALGSAPSPAEAAPMDNLAETISMLLHILLGHSHRHTEWLRTRPMPPHIPRTRGQQAYTLLRPIIARLAYIRSVKACVRYVGSLTQTLKNAGLDSSFSLLTPSVSVPETSGPNQPGRPQQVLNSLLQSVDFYITLKVFPETPLTIRGWTLLFPFTATSYTIQLPPSSPLKTMCAPHREYPDVEALADYINIATARLLTSHYLKVHQPQTDEDTKPKWALSLDATAIQAPEADVPSLSFTLGPSSLRVGHTMAQSPSRKPETKFWKWEPNKASSESKTLDDIVSQAISQT